jgi:hypothetical protein
MITLFTYPNGGYQVINPTPDTLITPSGATRADFDTMAELQAEIAAIPQPTLPDWDGFAAWAISNADLNTIAATAISNAPLASAGLPTALLQVQSGNLANFAATFDAVCTAGGATTTQRNTWADTARDDYDLPADFVAAVRGA